MQEIVIPDKANDEIIKANMKSIQKNTKESSDFMSSLSFDRTIQEIEAAKNDIKIQID